MRSALSVYFFAEVFIIRDQNPIFCNGFLDYPIIIHSARFFVDRKDFVFFFAEPVSYGRPCAFINQKAHLCRLHGQRHEGGIF